MSVQLRRANMRSIRAAPRVVLAFFRLRGGSRTRRPQRSSLHEPARRAHRMGRPRARVAGRGRRREGLAAARPARLACAGESARPAGAGRVAPGSTHLRRQVMRRSAAATRRGRTTSRQRFQDVLGLRRRARVVPGEVAISSGRSQLRELTTAPMKGGHDPPENGFPGKKALSQRFPVAVKQRLATRDASQGTPKTACQDSRQAQSKSLRHPGFQPPRRARAGRRGILDGWTSNSRGASSPCSTACATATTRTRFCTTRIRLASRGTSLDWCSSA